jgi:hypothetical protein
MDAAKILLWSASRQQRSDIIRMMHFGSTCCCHQGDCVARSIERAAG